MATAFKRGVMRARITALLLAFSLLPLFAAGYSTKEGWVLSSFLKGSYLLGAGSVRQALPYLEAAWGGSGRDPDIGQRLARAYFRAGKVDKCQGVVDDILSRRKDNFEALMLGAKLAYIRGQRKRARELLEAAAEQEPGSFEAQRLLGKVYLELGQDEQALAAYARSIAIDPQYPYLHYRYALLLKKFGKLEQAKSSLLTAIRLDPHLGEAVLELASIWVGEDRYAQAESLLVAFLTREPGSEEGVVGLARLYLREGKLDEGIRLLEKERREGGLGAEAQFLLGRFYVEAKEYEEAIDVLEGLFRREQNSPELARILGDVSLRAGRPERARKYYRQAIRLDPRDYRSYLGLFLGSTAKFVGENGKPIELPAEERGRALAKASQLVPPGDFEGNYLVGVAYQGADSLDKARLHLERAYKLDPENEAMLLALAGVEEQGKNFRRAEKYIKILYAKKPDDATVCNFYGYLLAEMAKELDKAEELVRKALRKDPQNGYYLDSLGWVYYMGGDYQKAVVELEKASARVSEDPVILEHLGDAYRALKRYRKALAAYEKSIELKKNDPLLERKIESTRKGLE